MSLDKFNATVADYERTRNKAIAGLMALPAGVEVECINENEVRPHALTLPSVLAPLDLSRALVSYRDLLTMTIAERARHLPWLAEGGNVMVFGPRGVGKTFLQLSLAVSLTTGQDLLKWKVSDPVGVLYVDGEMQLDELRQRATSLMVMQPQAPLEFLTSQVVYERCNGKDLVLTAESMRQEVVKILDARPDIRVIILDNISCLFSGINEDSKQDWEPINAWLIRLRHRGLATVLVHHAGKGGQQRGTSGREDSLDTVIQLDKPSDHDAREGCHFEMKFTKCRSVKGEEVMPIDVRLEDRGGQLTWIWKSVEASKLERARQLMAEGVSGPSDLAEELGVTRGYASKLIKKLNAEAGR
jgi:putative DNA primase/helicase